MKKLFVLVICLLYVLLLRVFIVNYFADLNYDRAQKLLAQSDIVGALHHANASIKLNPMEPNYYKGRARILIASTYAATGDKKMVIKDTALNDLQMAYKLNPLNLVTVRNIVPLYYYLSVADLSSPQGDEELDESYITVTKNFYNQVQDMSPNDVGVYTLLAKYEKRLNLFDEYNYSRLKVKNLRPDLLEWHPSLK